MKPQQRGMFTCNCSKINIQCNSEALEFTNMAFTFFEVKFGINTKKIIHLKHFIVHESVNFRLWVGTN